MPLLLSRARSLAGIFARRLRSSFSTAFFLQRLWKPHSGQCLFKIKSGADEEDNRLAILPTILLAVRDKASVLSLEVVPLSPRMTLAIPTRAPKAFASTSASK